MARVSRTTSLGLVRLQVALVNVGNFGSIRKSQRSPAETSSHTQHSVKRTFLAPEVPGGVGF